MTVPITASQTQLLTQFALTRRPSAFLRTCEPRHVLLCRQRTTILSFLDVTVSCRTEELRTLLTLWVTFYCTCSNYRPTLFRKRLEMLKETSAKYGAMIYGNTDSEHLAALYFTYLGDIDRQYPVETMRDAMKKAVEFVRDTQIRLLGKEVSNSMNLCTSKAQILGHCAYN